MELHNLCTMCTGRAGGMMDSEGRLASLWTVVMPAFHHDTTLPLQSNTVASALTNLTSCFLFIASRIPRAAGGRQLKRTQARVSCTSKRPSLFFTQGPQEPPLFPGGNQILLEIFLSDITIYRALALVIMFVSDLYMSTWPINFIRG